MIVITGGAGFIGSHLVKLLATTGETLRVVEKPGVNVNHLPSTIDIAFADITDRVAVRQALRGATSVYHLAADPNLWAARRGHFHRVNFLGTVNVLEEAVAAGAERILHCSTESILTRVVQATPIAEDQVVPLCEVIGPYCRSKYLAERHAFRMAKQVAPIVVVNPTLPVGPGDRGRSPPTRMMLDFLTHGRPAYIDAELNLIDVRDVATGMMRAMAVGEYGRRYLLGSESWSVKRIFDFLAELTRKPPPKWKVPYAGALAVAYVSEFLADTVTKQSPAATITGVKLTRRRMTFDASRSLAALGLVPRPVSESLREFVANWQAQPLSLH
ncbi:NAD-dependent epimerase/dehydratase family protein [soil metagenome]